MSVMRRLGFMGVGIVVVGSLSGAPVIAAEKSTEDGPKITITSPRDGEKVNDSFELTYELSKDLQGAHAHVYVDDVYQKGFRGTVKGLDRGTHTITVTASSKDHDLLPASHTITVEVP